MHKKKIVNKKVRKKTAKHQAAAGSGLFDV